MNRTSELRGFAEDMNYLSENERRQAQNYYDSLLDGRTQVGPPRWAPLGKVIFKGHQMKWRI